MKLHVKHVTETRNVPSIRKDGFKVPEYRNAFAHVFGPGVYFGFVDDEDSESFYACNGHNRTPDKCSVIEATVRLDNPLVASGSYDAQSVRASLIAQFGGHDRVVAGIHRAIPDLGARFRSESYDWQSMNHLTVGKWVHERYSCYDAEEILGYAARALGYDGLVIDQQGSFSTTVGGSQVVVFNPDKRKIRITNVRPVERESWKWG